MRPPLEVAQLARAVRRSISFPGNQENARVTFEFSVENAEIGVRVRIYGEPVLRVDQLEKIFGVVHKTAVNPYGISISGEYMRRHLDLDIVWWC